MTTGRVRIVIALAVVSALTLMAGLLLAIAGLVLRTGKHPQHGLIMFGLDVAVAGLAFGAGLLLIFVLLRGGFTAAGARDATGSRPSGSRSTGSRPGGSHPAGARRPPVPRSVTAAVGGGPRLAPAGDRGSGPHTTPAQQGSAQARARNAGPAGTHPQATVPHVAAPQAAGVQPHATGPLPRVAAPQPHAAGPQPHATGPQPHATGPQPHATGPQLHATGPQPHVAVPQPQATGPQPHATGPQPRPTGPFPAAHASGPPGPPRAAPGTASPSAAPGAVPPSAGTGTARPGPAGPRPVPDPRLSHGPAGAHLDGAPPRSSPRPPEPVRAAQPNGGATRPGPAGPAPDPVFVYRDTGDDTSAPTVLPTGADAPSRSAADQEAAYWYGRDEDPGKASAEPERGPFEPVRGPFEPLHHSAGGMDQAPGPAGGAPGSADRTDPDGPVARRGQEPRQAAQAQNGSPDPARQDGAGPDRAVPDERADQHARKLEQIKDLYLTAETIGEANVARHFDQFLAQQRELIGDYIKQSKAALRDDSQAVDPTAT